jgi:hypothetical protein
MSDTEFRVRAELDRAMMTVRKATHPDHMKEAVLTLALCVKGLMQSFGIEDVRVRASAIRGSDGKTPSGYVFEQLDGTGRTMKRATALAPVIEDPSDLSN